MRYLLPLLLLLGGCASSPDLRQTALVLRFDRGLCSGTAVGPDTLWTAQHCFRGTDLKTINGQPAKVVSKVALSRDRVVVRIEGQRFKHWSKVGPAPYQGQRIRFIGNPGGNEGVYREGYIARVRTNEVVLVAPICHGDSGAGIHDDEGRVIGIVSAMTSESGCVFGLSL